MKKILYIVLDGLGDLPNPDLDMKTPLEAAYKPNLDSLAKQGITGLVYPVGEGIAPESDIAVISLLGYDPKIYYTGRGPLEAHAAGLEVKEGDLAYRVNFATIGKDNRIIDRRVGRNLTSEEAAALAEEINKKVILTSHPATFKFLNTIGHRGVLVIRSMKGKLSGRVTNTDPAYGKEGPFGVAKEVFEDVLLECQPEPGFENVEEAKISAQLTNEFIAKSRTVLEEAPINKKRIAEGKLPANVILTRDAGDKLPQFPNIVDLHKMKFGCFVEMPVEKGIAILTGMEVIAIPLPTGIPAQDYPIRAEKTITALKDYDALYIHLKGPDEPGHDGKALKKKESIEAIDKFFFSNLLPHINLSEVIIAVTSDHSTPCTLKAHSADPVPLLICGNGITPDKTQEFSERTCRNGTLSKLRGIELLPLLVHMAKKNE